MGYDRRMAQEVDGSVIGEEFTGYIFRISGGNDKQGFPMRQGVLTNSRVRLLCKKGHKTYRQRRTGERKRKSVRGCIVGQDIAVLNLVVTKIGENSVPGLTDGSVPRRLGPKRARKAAKINSVLKNKEEAAAYKKIIMQRLAEQREARKSLISKRRSTRKSVKLVGDSIS